MAMFSQPRQPSQVTVTRQGQSQASHHLRPPPGRTRLSPHARPVTVSSPSPQPNHQPHTVQDRGKRPIFLSNNQDFIISRNKRIQNVRPKPILFISSCIVNLYFILPSSPAVTPRSLPPSHRHAMPALVASHAFLRQSFFLFLAAWLCRQVPWMETVPA